MLTDEEIQAEAEACYNLFISSKPHKSSYVGGFIFGAIFARSELAALRERVATLEEIVRGLVAWDREGLDIADPPSRFGLGRLVKMAEHILGISPPEIDYGSPADAEQLPLEVKFKREGGSIVAGMEAIREAGGKAWDGVADPQAYLAGEGGHDDQG